MTQIEKELIANLRRKIGDNPVREVISNDIGNTIYFLDGSSKVADINDIGKTILDLEKIIWTNEELLEEIYDSFYIIFENNKKDLSDLDELEKRIVTLAARVELTFQLATNAARYIRYQAQSINVNVVDPNEFLNLAKALKESLQEILDDYVGRDIDKVKQGIIHYVDRYDDLLKPTKYEPTPAFPDFNLNYNNGCIYLNSDYVFINNFREIFIKKKTDTTETIIFESDVCREYSIKDCDVQPNKTYKYIVYLRTINDELFSKEYVINTNVP